MFPRTSKSSAEVINRGYAWSTITNKWILAVDTLDEMRNIVRCRVCDHVTRIQFEFVGSFMLVMNCRCGVY